MRQKMIKLQIKPLLSLTAITFLVIFVYGCGTSPRANFYLLEEDVSIQLSGIEQGIVVGLNPVNIAPYLDRPQIVTRTRSHKLELSEFNRWVESLDTSISRVIAVNLSNLLKSNRVYILPRHNKTIPLEYQISIEFARLDGRLGGDAKLAARWALFDKDGRSLITKVTVLTEPTTGNNYEHLVAAENRALKTLSFEIAEAIKNNY